MIVWVILVHPCFMRVVIMMIMLEEVMLEVVVDGVYQVSFHGALTTAATAAVVILPLRAEALQQQQQQRQITQQTPNQGGYTSTEE